MDRESEGNSKTTPLLGSLSSFVVVPITGPPLRHSITEFVCACVKIRARGAGHGEEHSLQEKTASVGGEEREVQSRGAEEMLGPPPQTPEREDRGHGRRYRREWVLIRMALRDVSHRRGPPAAVHMGSEAFGVVQHGVHFFAILLRLVCTPYYK